MQTPSLPPPFSSWNKSGLRQSGIPMEILLRRALLIFLGIDNCKSGQRIREPKCNEKEVGGGGDEKG